MNRKEHVLYLNKAEADLKIAECKKIGRYYTCKLIKPDPNRFLYFLTPKLKPGKPNPHMGMYELTLFNCEPTICSITESMTAFNEKIEKGTVNIDVLYDYFIGQTFGGTNAS